MGDVEEYFPRGGKKPTVTYFKQSGNFLGAAEKGERKKQKPKKKSEDDDGYLSEEIVTDNDQSYKNCGIYLNYKIVKEGHVLLGRVSHVLDTKIHISIPCRLTGTVMACHVSEAYNKILEAYVNDQTDVVRELQQMFRLGQYVSVKVLEVGSNSLMLSMMPQHVNAGRSHSELHKGTMLQAAVTSVEDHGYVMDVGIGNTRAFLPKTSTNPDLELDVGMLTWCCVKTLVVENDNSVLTLSSELESLRSAVQRRHTNTLQPGTALEFTIDKSLDNGIEGHVFQDTVAYVQRQQVDKVKGKKPNFGQKVRARVLYVLPTRNTPFLTMKNIFESTYPDLEKEQNYKEGDIIEDAQVIKILGRSIMFKLSEGSMGTLSLRRIQVDEDLTDEDVIAKTYPIGSTHVVRVLCYNLSDYIYSLSDEPAVLSEKTFTMSDLTVGDVVPATVRTVTDDRVFLSVGRVTGFVPKTHMSDAGFYLDPKKASTTQLTKKFKEGQQVKARVLNMDLKKSVLILTLKPSLLAPDLEILKSYEDAVEGKTYTGVVTCIRNYLLVSFFNGVTCYVASAHVARPPPPSLDALFHLGQIVNCTILKVYSDNKMSGSLLADPYQESKKEKKASKRQNTEDTPLPKKKPKKSESEIETKTSDKKEKKNKRNKSESTEDEQNEEKENPDVEQKISKKKEKKNKKNIKDLTEDVQNEHNENTENENKETNNVQDGSNTEKKTRKKKKELTKVDEADGCLKIDEIFQKNELTDEEDQDVNTNKGKGKRHKKNNEDEQTKKGKEKPKDSDTNETKNKAGKKKKNIDDSDEVPERKKRKESVSSEDRDKATEDSAIDTDVHEDSDDMLTPQDHGLMDLSDCTTPKHYKRRIISLLKTVQRKMRRINRVENKISSIENRGITVANKKFHTAMLTEKFLLENGVKKLLEALKVAQDTFKEFNLEVKKKKEKEEKKITDLIEFKGKSTEVKEDVPTQKDKVTEKRKNVKVDSLESVMAVPSAKEFWSPPAAPQHPAPQEESSDSEEEEDEKPKKKRKKLRAAERLARAREEEENIREVENNVAEAAAAPRSADEFERALLANPDSSQLWIAYMAFHLQATEVEMARAVGRRALRTITFREEQEKLNVWLAMLNFEHRFGTRETQQKILDEALQMNEKYQIHSKLLDIYVETGKASELIALVELMMRKYRHRMDVFAASGAACYTLGLLDKARQIMQKGLATLEKREHVSLLVRFAKMERECGEPERSAALLEHVLAAYPQRVDVAAQYIDMLLKNGDIQRVRQVLERMTSQKLPARKMKVLFRKWIEVEENVGDPEQVENIRRRAMEFIEKAKY